MKASGKIYLFFFGAIILLATILRLITLTGVPRALHGDELGVGYNAFTILLSGKDEYGKSLPLVFRSDFTPLIFYATVPFIKLFSLNEWSTRLPTALIGIATIPAIYFLTKELTRNKKLALITVFLIAISPWHIRTSRIALELTWGFFLQIMGTYFFLRSLSGKHRNLVISFLFFGLSVFAYHSTKMTTPLLLGGLFIIFKNSLSIYYSIRRFLILGFIFILIPLLIYLSVQSFSNIRFVGISVFTQWKNLPEIKSSLFSLSSFITLLGMILSNYLVHFSPKLLFFTNMNLRYYQLEYIGLFYHWEIITIIMGFLLTVSLVKRPEYRLLFFWLLLAPLAAAFTTGVPYANIGRIMMFLFPMEVFSGIGIMKIYSFIKTLKPQIKTRIIGLLLFAIGFSTTLFLLDYFINTPPKVAQFWGSDYKIAAQTALSLEPQVNHIIFTDKNPQAYMYILFYGKIPPNILFAQQTVRNSLIGYNKIGEYEFRKIAWESEQVLPQTLYIGSAQEIPATIPNRLTSLMESDSLRILRVD